MLENLHTVLLLQMLKSKKDLRNTVPNRAHHYFSFNFVAEFNTFFLNESAKG